VRDASAGVFLCINDVTLWGDDYPLRCLETEGTDASTTMSTFDDLVQELSSDAARMAEAAKTASRKKTGDGRHSCEAAIRKIWEKLDAKIDATESYHEERVICVEFIGNYVTSMTDLSAGYFKINKDKSAAKAGVLYLLIKEKLDALQEQMNVTNAECFNLGVYGSIEKAVKSNVEGDSMLDVLYALSMLTCNKLINNQLIRQKQLKKDRNPFNLANSTEQIDICTQIVQDFQRISISMKDARNELLADPEEWL